MIKIHNIENAVEIIKTLVSDVYNPIWWVIDDFEVNGHIVQCTGVNQWGHIVIDDYIVDARLSTSWGIPDNDAPTGMRFVNGLEYAEMKLREEVKKENV